MKVRKNFVLIWFFCFFLFFSNSLLSENKKKILIINSDSSVKKYNEVQNEFKKAFPYPPIKEINLNEKKWNSISSVKSVFSEKHPDLIYCIGTKAYMVANKHAPRNTAIVFSSIINWLRLPMKKSETYGVSNELHIGMQLMLFRYIFPDIKRIGLLYGKKYNSEWLIKTKKEGKEIGIKVIARSVSKNKDTLSSLKELLGNAEALWLISDPSVIYDKNILIELLKICDEQKTPVFSYHEVFAKYGAVLIVSADNLTIGRQSAGIALEVLNKRKLEKKVQFPAGSYITLNLKKVKEYGLTYSKDALEAVNSVIE